MTTNRLRRLMGAAFVVAALAAVPQVGSAQGPGPVGITRAVYATDVRRLSWSSDDQAARRRVSAAGSGALIGMAVGVAFGYLATRPPGPGGGDGLGFEAVVGMAVIGAGIGALLGYMIGQR